MQPVADRAAAQAVVDALRARASGAAHVCWALMAGGQSAANDDGEPGGTAGRPMLEVLRHHELEGVLATVVRYFGGVKLGAGGLVRAYTDSVAQALIGAPLVPLVRQRSLQCAVPYALEGAAAARDSRPRAPRSSEVRPRRAGALLLHRCPNPQLPSFIASESTMLRKGASSGKNAPT